MVQVIIFFFCNRFVIAYRVNKRHQKIEKIIIIGNLVKKFKIFFLENPQQIVIIFVTSSRTEKLNHYSTQNTEYITMHVVPKKYFNPTESGCFFKQIYSSSHLYMIHKLVSLPFLKNGVVIPKHRRNVSLVLHT